MRPIKDTSLHLIPPKREDTFEKRLGRDVWRKFREVYALNKIERIQSNSLKAEIFKTIQQQLKFYELDDESEFELNERRRERLPAQEVETFDKEATQLFYHRKDVARLNNQKILDLNRPLFKFAATSSNHRTIKEKDDRLRKLNKDLYLSVGTKVFITENLNT